MQARVYFSLEKCVFFKIIHSPLPNINYLLYLCSRYAENMAMNRIIYIFLGIIIHYSLFIFLTACSRPSRVEQYKAEKYIRDSIRLEEQTRSLAFYESQLERTMPVADSLLQYFRYERNEKYQDHGYYVVRSSAVKPPLTASYRILVRDDGKETLVYRDGKRVDPASASAPLKGAAGEGYALAEQLRVTILDIKELEHRIARTSLEIQKYQTRLQK